MGEKLAFLGLGVMGYPMAGHLAKAGYTVTVYNRTTAKAEKWVAAHGGNVLPIAVHLDVVLQTRRFRCSLSTRGVGTPSNT
ncbi:MAG: NAD(P)-binding domain-containing protein, partial [SAR324 cluster bacterium]|nr:NAD(P)-binding domain-containing protein [SAR324 cluster bacterium]